MARSAIQEHTYLYMKPRFISEPQYTKKQKMCWRQLTLAPCNVFGLCKVDKKISRMNIVHRQKPNQDNLFQIRKVASTQFIALQEENGSL
jgi:hypothetical protein